MYVCAQTHLPSRNSDQTNTYSAQIQLTQQKKALAPYKYPLTD